MNQQQIIDFLASRLGGLSQPEIQQVLKSKESLKDFAEDNGLDISSILGPGIVIIIWTAILSALRLMFRK